MRHYLSLTGTLKAVLTGDIHVRDFLDNDSVAFAFSCCESHVLSPDRNLVPMEATWCNNDRIGERGEGRLDTRKPVNPFRYQNDADEHLQVHYDAVDERLQSLLHVFMGIVELFDADGRVAWEIGNQPAYIAKLPDQDCCYFEGKWRWSSEFRDDKTKTLAEAT